MNNFYVIKQVLLSIIFGLVSFSALADGAKVTPLIQKELDGLKLD